MRRVGSCPGGGRDGVAKVRYRQYVSTQRTQIATGRSCIGDVDISDEKAPSAKLKRRREILTAFLSDIEKWDAEFARCAPTAQAMTAKKFAVYVGTGGIYAAVCPDSPDCSASRSAIARDVRSRNKIAATTPPTTATTSAIQEKRVSQRSAAMPA